MTSAAVKGLLAAGSLAAALAATLGEGDPSAPAVLAVAALGLATLLVALTLGERVHRRAWVPAVPDADPLVLVREGFRSGPLGRQALVAAIAGLERSFGGSAARPVTPEEERRLRSASPEEFREWVRGRLEALEAAT